MTGDELDALEKLTGEATPGPWDAIIATTTVPAGYLGPTDAQITADARFFAAAPNALPELLAEVRRLREALAALENRNGP